MKVAILCGGRGLRFGDSEIPKPMQQIGGRPLIYHIMRWYARHGHREFVLCLGWRGDVIRDYFGMPAQDEPEMRNLGCGPQGIAHGSGGDTIAVAVQCVDTGLETSTGGRLLRVRELLGERFMLTYGDCLADVHLPALTEFHLSHGKAATVTVVQPRLPWGVCNMNIGGEVHRFVEKPRYNQWCNGGFMVMDSRVFKYVREDNHPIEDALIAMAQVGELHGFKHGGFWRGCDTEKDRRELDGMWCAGGAPWKT